MHRIVKGATVMTDAFIRGLRARVARPAADPSMAGRRCLL